MLAAGPLCRLSCYWRVVQSAVCIHLSPSERKYQAGVVMPAGASMQKDHVILPESYPHKVGNFYFNSNLLTFTKLFA